jgi:predicted PolB exonuclease-like 3'-5' exonuclease
MHVQVSSGFSATEDPVQFALYGDEKQMLEDFWAYVAKERFRFISYNGLGFDVPWIILRSMKYGIRPTNQYFLTTKRFQRWPHSDVMQLLGDWDRRRTCTLDLACETFGIETPKKGKIKADGVEDAYLAGDIEGIRKYCLKDLVATYELYKLIDSYQPNQN